jgi:hypothetical protein
MCDELTPLIAQQEKCQMRVLAPAQVPTLRVLDRSAHNYPDAPWFLYDRPDGRRELGPRKPW